MFRTEIIPETSSEKIGLQSLILSIGSCFADNVGANMIKNKLKAHVNPFGVTFNPYSVFKLLDYVIDIKFPPENSYLQNQGVYYNYDLHSDFSSTDKNELKNKVEDSIRQVHDYLINAEWLILTFGTAIIYIQKKTNDIVANCHKVPQKYFEKSMLSQKVILREFDNLINKLHVFNPKLNIIVTVSPVRHLKESLIQNSVSKSILRISCDTLEKTYPEVSYFPAYELLLDDLRDYRFYADDLLHPSEEARKYIWNKFAAAFFDEETKTFLKEWEKLKKAFDHKAFHPGTEQHKQFIVNTLDKLKNFPYPVDLNIEISKLEEQLNEWEQKAK